MKFSTAYLKLTAFYVLIAMAISVSFSIALYNISSNELGRGLGRQAGVLINLQIGPGSAMSNLEQIRQDQIKESNSRLAVNLIYFNLLILILSSGMSYFLARKTMRPIEEAMEAQNRFTADASHELRTPLTAMKSEIEVTLRDNDLKLNDAKKLLGSNLEEIGKLESLSNALLKLARYQDEARAKFCKVSLEEAAAEAYEKIESLADQKSIEFDNELEDIIIKGDGQSLTELFVILFDNAIKYSGKNSKIFVSIKKESKLAILKIKDQGIGIKASDLPYIFNRFYRADRSRSKERVDGYGLGLSIAKQIVELHQGNISVTSKPGKGSEFTIKIPIIN